MFRNMSLQGRSLVLVSLVFLTSAFMSGCGGGSNATGEITTPNAELTSLVFEGYSLDFSPGKRNGYDLTLPQDVTSVNFTAAASEGSELTYTLRSIIKPTTALSGIELPSGEAVAISVEEGDNLLSIRVADPDSTVAVVYTVRLHRISSQAKLNTLVFFNLLDSSLADANYFLPISPEFDSTVYDYTSTVNSLGCAISARLATNERNTTATLNGSTIGHLQSRQIPLGVGENVITAAVTSEDGTHTENYTVTITRPALTDDEAAANARLIDLELSAADLNYVCTTTAYGAVVSYDDQVVTLTATPEVEGVTMTLAKTAEDGTVPDGESQPVNTPIELTLDEGGNTYTVTTTSPDGTSNIAYTILINRISRNIVNVTTAEELQAALKEAEPRDEIRVFGGSYTGVASADASGSEAAHFYSNQSGTEDHPIRIVGSSNGTAILSGGSAEANAVLMLQGDHWLVSNLTISGAQNGVILDGANAIELNGLTLSGTGQQGIVVRNGSSNNLIQNSLFESTGEGAVAGELASAEAVVIGSDSSEWVTAPGGAGSYEHANLNNVIRSNVFRSGVIAEAIEVNEGSENTLIEYNEINAGGLVADSGANSLILIQGNDTTIRFNSFYVNSDDNLEGLVSVQPASGGWHDSDWGMNTRFNDNIAMYSGANFPAVLAGDGNSVFVVNNTRDDDLDMLYSGALVNTTDIDSPVFQIRTADIDDQCLGLETTDGVEYVKILACSDSAKQQWKLLRDDEGFVRIQNVGSSELYVRPVRGFSSRCEAGAVTSYVYGSTTTEAFLQRWLLSFQGSSVYFLNKENTAFAITSGTADVSEDSYTVACPTIYTTAQRFELIEI